MSDVVLSAELQAKVDKFISNLLGAANQADKTATSVNTMTSNVSRNIANVNRLNLNQFTTALNAGTLSVQKLAQSVPQITRPVIAGANQAANALTNVGRVAQDLPFGFIGIQNNLNPLLESFQRLKAETGSNAAAFRSLGSSLLGPAGIGVALSVISAGILIFNEYQRKANKELENAKKNAGEYIDTLDGVSAALLKGREEGAKEISNLNTLFALYQNANIPLAKRKEAYEELQRIYPEYFGNIKFEKEATDKTTTAYQNLAASIISTAKARGLSDRIGQNAIKEEETLNKIRNTEDAIRKSRKTDTSFADAFGGSKETRQLLESQIQLQKEFNNLKQEDLRLQGLITDEVKDGASIKNGFGSPGGDKDKVIKVKPKRIDLELPENPQQIFTDFFNKLSSLNTDNDTLKVKVPKKGIEIVGAITKFKLPPVDVKDLQEQIKALNIQIGIEKLGEGAEKAVKDLFFLPNVVDTLATSLSQSFDAMGSAIASGGNALEAGGQVLKNVVGGIMASLGQQLITLGAAKVAAGVLATPFGGKLVAEGAGLIAIGSALSLAGGVVKSAGNKNNSASRNSVPQIRGFATGGDNLRPGLALVGERGPEIVNLPTGASVSNNTKTNRILADGNKNNVVIAGELSVGIDKLYAKLKAYEKKEARKM